jgi:hypothetical protein
MGLPVVAVGAARAYAEKIFGGPLTEQETNPTCGISATVLIDGNGDRVGLVIVNQGANNVFISTGPAPSTTNGILLSSSGGSVTMDVTKDFTLPTRRWYGIANGGTSAMYVLEILRVSFGTPGL